MWEVYAVAATLVISNLAQYVVNKQLTQAKFAKLVQSVGDVQECAEQLNIQLEDAQKGLKAAVSAQTKAEKLASLHIEKNSMFSDQANEAWRLYREAGLRASNAQMLMLREIDRLARVVNSYRAKEGKEALKMNSDLQKIYEDFKRDHVEPQEAQHEL